MKLSPPPLPLSRLEAALERVLVPPTAASADGSTSGFARVVGVVASVAVGFFLPALAIAGVPVDRWPLFVLAAAVAGVVVGGSFIVIGRSSRWLVPTALVNSLAVAGLGYMFHPYFNQLVLLYALVVAAHGVVHGLRPALVAAILGAVLVPLTMQIDAKINPTDHVYALIYLVGAALVPWTAERLAARRAVALRDQLALTLATEREAVMILARAAEAKDQVTGDHVVRVGDISAQLAMRAGAGEPAAEDIRFAGMLHDVGKLHVPDELLTKPGQLTDEEWAIVQRHTIWGERILGSSAGFELARRIARSHHENWDGSGYPDRLRGEAIPLAARIVRLADALDAMRNPRPYKDAWPLERCLDEIERGAGSLFDPELARELLLLYGQAARAAAWRPNEPERPRTRPGAITAHA
jgi:hypothetical protein